MPRPRRFTSAPPKGWITKQQLLTEAELGERTFDGWAEKLGLRTRLVSHGRGGITSYYPPGTVATLKRLDHLSANSKGNMDDWIWQLWLEGQDVDISAWASMHLADGLKRLGRRSTKAYRFIFDRILKPLNRTALYTYANVAASGGAGPDRKTSLHNAEPPIFDLLLKVAGLPDNAMPPSGELKKVEHRFSRTHLIAVLGDATEQEREQARRDWQMLARWIDAIKDVDWDNIRPEMDAKLRLLMGARAEPQSIIERKTRHRRPLKPPVIIQTFRTLVWSLAARAALLPFLIELRRSPFLDFVISAGAVMFEIELDKLPRKSVPEPAE